MTGLYMKRNTGLKWVKRTFSGIKVDCYSIGKNLQRKLPWQSAKRINHGSFPVNFAKLYRPVIFQKTFGGLLPSGRPFFL